VRADLRTDPEGAALKSASFALPATELLDLRRVRELCSPGTAVADCPRRSLLGSVQVFTPLLEAPLEGAIYLRAPGHRLPGVTGELRSGGVRLIVRGRTTDAHGRLGVALESIPDLPLTRVVLRLVGGRRGIIVNSRSLCWRTPSASAVFTAHNGMRRQRKVPLRSSGCR
jgi:hypothetical protein